MKIRLLFLILSMSVGYSLLQAQTIAVPDANFENYLETHTADGSVVNVGDENSLGDGIANNNLIFTDRLINVVTLNVIDLEIADLTGIEGFTSLEILVCSNNRLSTIDVSLNTNLKLLNISNNRITGELIVSNNLNLESLFCSSNQISTLDLSANPVLKNLNASGNSLTNLDLSAINTVVCPDPQTNPVTLCQGAASINVSRNQLTSLIVNNGFNELISSFDASENLDLFCIQLDAGFTPANWIKDDWTYYSENTCVDIYTYIPDANFEEALIDLGYDDSLDNLVLTANINTITDLNVSNAFISSLVGIEDFIALETLDCSNNSLDGLDISSNLVLQELNSANNSMSVLDLSANTVLTELNCANNLIASIDLSANTDLARLQGSNNVLTSLDLSSNLVLSDLDVSFNQIESLNLAGNTELISVVCSDNNLFSLNLNNGNNAVLTTFNATNTTNLFCIEVDDVAFANAAIGWQKDAIANYNLDCGTYIPDDNFEQALIDLGIDSDNTLNNFVATADINTLLVLDISSLAIENLTGIQDFTALQNLNCSNNNLSSLDLSTLLDLQVLEASNNQITALNLTANTALTTIVTNNNALLHLNIENGNNGILTNLNATNNPNLYCINVDDAIVGTIPVAWQKDPIATYNGDCLNNRFTAIPDAFFEQALIDLGYDTLIDGQVLTANIEQVLSLDISDKSIEDLTGVRDFKSLKALDCSGNYLETLDLSDMLYLERLNCSSNDLLTNDINDPNGLLNLTGLVNLTELYCASNNLNYLDTSQNTELQLLDCADNNLTLLDVNLNGALSVLNCSNNNLTSLDLSANTLLEEVNCDSNQLNELLTANVLNTSLTTLSCANNSLPNLLVNNYQSLTDLNCGSNVLTELNVASNPSLSFLSVTNNQMSELNLLTNPDLRSLNASQNNLTQLVLFENTLLEQLNCDFNDLAELDLSSNQELQSLSCTNNQIAELNLNNTTNLIEANFSSNAISNLMLSNNLGTLKSLDASNNQIEGALDLNTMATSACVFQPNQTQFCPESITVNISNNLFDFVTIQNGINASIANFNASGNPNLDCIQVDNPVNVPANWIKDEATAYNNDCNFGETYVPDDNFEQALIDLGLDTGPLNDYVLTANIETLLSLDVSSNAISDLTGIEDFIALENLDCSNNSLNELNLSSNINLLNVNCSNNTISELNLETNTALNTLNCSANTISNLIGIENTSLSDLDISNNLFTAFNPSEVLSLEVFNADTNSIVELDFQQNQSLTNLNCASNLLETLNIRNGQNASLINLNAQNNPDLICIETDNGSAPDGANWLIDATAQFAINCFFGQTYVPDDNFEQALIDLGYDSGELDDYVFTENIEGINVLNLASREISDLTGIEAFVSLTALNFKENTIQLVDLSTNTLLVNLDASNNLLSDLDLSALLNLTTLNVSNNNLSELNFDMNIILRDVNIANNALTELNSETLISLEKLNCASNQLSALNVSLNPNLNLLFCQSNLLVGDQLNLQNGNNENLQLFNAINNPDLLCILVDDSVAVISNEDGLYDNWFKDAAASYQLICDDADNDGVPNEDDLCPNTEFGATVDLFGCALPNLPNDNFSISITGETCLNSNNGKITIVGQELYSYTATLTRDNFSQTYNFTNDVDIFNLLAGTYDMCITMEEWPDYQSCYTIVITQPDPLVVFSSRMASSNRLSLSLSGSTSYKIDFNGETFTTHNSSITLELQQGINEIRVSTGLECQGIYEERIMHSEGYLLHPNPFNNKLSIYSDAKDEEITINIYSTFGQVVLTKAFVNKGEAQHIDTSSLASGMYLITMHSKSMVATYKIIKE